MGPHACQIAASASHEILITGGRLLSSVRQITPKLQNKQKLSVKGGSHAEMKMDKVMCSDARAHATAHVLGLMLAHACMPSRQI